MMSFPWRGFILLLSRAVKALSLGRSQPRLLDGKGSGKRFYSFLPYRKDNKKETTCSKHAKTSDINSFMVWCPEDEGAHMPRPRWSLEVNPKTSGVGVEQTDWAQSLLSSSPSSIECLLFTMKLDGIPEADMTAAFVPVSLRNTRDAKSVSESKHKVRICVCFERLTIEFQLQKNNSWVFKHTRPNVKNPAW